MPLLPQALGQGTGPQYRTFASLATRPNAERGETSHLKNIRCDHDRETRLHVSRCSDTRSDRYTSYLEHGGKPSKSENIIRQPFVTGGEGVNVRPLEQDAPSADQGGGNGGIYRGRQKRDQVPEPE